MHLRKLVILLGVLSLLVSRSVLALGLGDISLNSSLNQPLDAHIGLRDLGDLSAEQIVIKLGTQEDFDKVGLERSFFYTQLRFNVVTDGPNGPFVAVTSRDPVREPYLSFVVDMRWTSGRVMREYTLLLDLPTFSGESAAPVQGSVTPIESKSRPVKNEPVRQRSDSGAVSADSAGGDVYGPVKASDTLWEIARDHRPGNASIHQTMLAIQKANPDAFIRNNINLLKKGQVLRIPSEREVRELNNRQAISRVAEQNREWSGNAMGAQLDGSGRNSASNRTSDEVSGRLRLASGSDSSDDAARNGGAGSAGSAALERELTDTKDELARSRGENTELRSRVGDLEEQIETMERLLEVSNEQMRALEVAAQQKNDADENLSDAAATPVTDDAKPAEDTGVAESSSAVKPAPEKTAAKPADKVEPEAKEPVRNTNKVVRRAPEPTLMDTLMDNLLWIVLAVVLIGLLVVLALRKRGSTVDESDDFTPDYDEPIAYEEAETQPENELADSDMDAGALDDSLFDETDADESAESVEPETGDVVGEADIYIALGKYEQAEDMLLSALEREPGSMPISLKLLETYGESNNLDSFDARFAAIVEQGDEASIARASSLRVQYFPGAADFVAPAAGAALATGLASSATEQEDSVVESDFDQSFDLNDSAPLADGGANSDDLDDDFDFDLSDELDDSALKDDEELQLDDMDSSPAASDELELDESSSRYDLSFESEDGSATDDALLEFDLDLDDDAVANEPESAESDDVFALDLEDDQQDSQPLDDIEFTLGDTEGSTVPVEDSFASQSESGSTASTDELDDLEFDLDSISDESDKSAEDGVSLTDEAPLLDEDFSFDTTLDLEPEEEPATSYSEPEPYDPSSEEAGHASVDLGDELAEGAADEEEVPTLDLAEDDADDFDLDKAMDDFDLASMDEDMADLDAAADNTVAEPAGLDDDDTFEQALGDLDTEASADASELDDLPELDADDADLDDEDLDFLTDSDEVTTKLDLARAYIDMGDLDGARDILSEVSEEGNEEQKAEALSLLDKAQS
ncbi:FimV/HubP family polar landmark protein [uncultured Gilvimarinus sp.]|uniref:FimV/HubP family polar landmark protein n=1 Tax=uncultured Gilvimarinus sp. TaxID=1689143 RepID=UPI0030DAEEA4